MTCKYYHCMYAASLCMTMANFHTKSFFYLSRRFQGEINMALNGVKMTSGSGDPSKVNK